MVDFIHPEWERAEHLVLRSSSKGVVIVKCDVCLEVEALHGTTEWVSPWLCRCPSGIPGTITVKSQPPLRTESTVAVRIKYWTAYLVAQAEEIEKKKLDDDGSALRKRFILTNRRSRKYME